MASKIHEVFKNNFIFMGCLAIIVMIGTILGFFKRHYILTGLLVVILAAVWWWRNELLSAT